MLSCFASVIFGKFFMRTGFSTCFAGLVSTALEQGFGVQNYLIIFGAFAFIFAVFFFILKDVFKRNSQGDSLPMGFRRGGSDSNGGGRSMVEEVALVAEAVVLAEAELVAAGKIYLLLLS